MTETTREAEKIDDSASRLSAVVSARVEIKDVVLSSATMRRAQLTRGLPDSLTAKVDVKSRGDFEAKRVCVHAGFSLVGTYEAEEQEQVRIDAVFSLTYELNSIEDLAKENIDAFGEINGVYNAWPYWREFVQMSCVRMGLPPLTVPVFRPIQTRDAGTSESIASSSGETCLPRTDFR